MTDVESAGGDGRAGAGGTRLTVWTRAAPFLRTRMWPTRRGNRSRLPHPDAARLAVGTPDGRLQVFELGDGGPYRLVGEADLAARETLRALLAPLAAGTGDVRLDVAGLTFIDVGSATELVGAAQRLGGGRRLVIEHAPPMLCRIIELAWGQLPGLELSPR